MEVTVKSRVSPTSPTLMSDEEVQYQRHRPHRIVSILRQWPRNIESGF